MIEEVLGIRWGGVLSFVEFLTHSCQSFVRGQMGYAVWNYKFSHEKKARMSECNVY